jgi:hypothetical protein
MADEKKPTPRVLLMEFSVSEHLLDALEPVDRTALLAQLGIPEDAEEVTLPPILVPVKEAAGGPKAVIEREAKVRGRFRAVAKDSYDQGHEAVPPEQQKFELRPLS